MTKQPPTFQMLPDVTGLYVARSGKAWSAAISVSADEVALYSPLPSMGQATVESLQAIGKVAYVIAPNHYHNKGVAQARKLFPRAKLVCSAAAKRARRQHHDAVYLWHAEARRCAVVPTQGAALPRQGVDAA